MKLFRKLGSLVLITAMTISSTNTLAAASTTVPVKSNNAIFSVQGAHAPLTLLNNLRDLGVSISNESLIEVLPATTSENAKAASALVVTNMQGTKITKDVLIMDNDKGLTEWAAKNSETIDYPPTDWDGRFVVRATAVFDSYDMLSTYYQPIGVYFTYTKYQPCTVNSIDCGILMLAEHAIMWLSPHNGVVPFGEAFAN